MSSGRVIMEPTYPFREAPEAEQIFVLRDPKADRYFSHEPYVHGCVFIRGASFFVGEETARKRMTSKWSQLVSVDLTPQVKP